MPRRLVLHAVCAVVLVAVLAPARPAGAQDETPPVETPPVETPAIEINEPGPGTITSLPRPNSGVQPERATERGGWLQIALVVLFIGFGAVAFFSIRRQGAAARSVADGP